MSSDTVLIDSDAFVGLQIKQDAHHQTATEIFAKIRAQKLKPVVTTLVVAETASLLSRRYTMADAKHFLKAVEAIPVIIIDEHLHRETVKLFQTQTRSKTSFVDIANVVVMQHLQMAQIFAFDKVYQADFAISTIN